MAATAPVARGLGHGARAFSACAAAFLLAAAVVAAVHAVVPIAHGWWLVSYLPLVGGVAQVALGEGRAALARHTGARPSGPAAIRWQLGLFNTGTVLVAVADVAGAAAGVLAGSVLLLGALALFAAGLRQVVRSAQRPAPVAAACYAALLAFLVVSVLAGAGLASALPGQ